MKKHLRTLMLVAFSSLAFAQTAQAGGDPWPCEVLLCMANPNGPTAENACEPPIEKLWEHLKDGHSFPKCDMGSDDKNSKNRADYQRAHVGNCPPQYIRYRLDSPDNGNLIPYCLMTRVITVYVDGQRVARIWNRGNVTRTEAFTPEYRIASRKFDEEYQAWYAAEQARIAKEEKEKRRERMFGGGN